MTFILVRQFELCNGNISGLIRVGKWPAFNCFYSSMKCSVPSCLHRSASLTVSSWCSLFFWRCRFRLLSLRCLRWMVVPNCRRAPIFAFPGFINTWFHGKSTYNGAISQISRSSILKVLAIANRLFCWRTHAPTETEQRWPYRLIQTIIKKFNPPA